VRKRCEWISLHSDAVVSAEKSWCERGVSEKARNGGGFAASRSRRALRSL
jgi:hypothetical protein